MSTVKSNITTAINVEGVQDHIAWIRNVLIPHLVESEKLRPGSGVVSVKNVDICRLLLSESFMWTTCYKIKVAFAVASSVENGLGVDEEVQMVIKISPELDEERQKFSAVGDMFHNEETAYNMMLPMLGRSQHYPKCYYTHNRPDSAVIVLSDFTADGWSMASLMYNLSFDHILVSVAELGKFQGQLYGMKHKNRSEFERLCGEFRESRFHHDHTSEYYDRRLRIGPKRATAAVRKNSAGDQHVPEWFLQRLEQVLENPYLYQKNVALRHVEPLAIMCHGDFLRNNIAYKYNSEQVNIPEKAMMFDFQTIRYASPMLDLVTFMLNSTGVEVRRPNFDRIFATYHTTLCNEFVLVTGISPRNSSALPDYLSAAAFLREYALYLPFGLSICAAFLPFLYEPPEELTEIANLDEDAWNRGGNGLDVELCAIVTEIFDLYARLGLELNDKF